MEAGEGNNGNLKRQRTPLSDSEDNVLPPSEVNDDQKRRRLEAAGQENHSPQPSCSGRLTEQETKADTPMVLPVQSPVQQLTQRPEGGAPLAQRRLLDPGADGFREYLLGEGEFNQRLERFKVPVFQAGPTPTLRPANPPPRTRSNLVSAVQQKLQGTPAPSSQHASHIRQARERELSRLHFQPIGENAWLKRSTSDPSLFKTDGDAEMKDASFPGASTSHAEKQSSDGTGERAPGTSEAPEESVELENSEGRLHMEWIEQSTHRADKVREETGNEEKQLGTQQPQTQTVLKLSFSEDQSCSKAPFSEDQNVSELPTGDEQSLLESTRTEESNMKEQVDVSIGTEQGGSQMFSWEEIDGSSYSEEGIEPSTDEELRSWRYPQGKVCKEEESIIAEEHEEDECVKKEDRQLESSRVEKENRGSVADHSEPSDIQDGECYWGNVSAEIAGSSEMQEDKKPRPEEDESESCLEDFVKDHSNLNRHILEIEEMELDAVDERQGVVEEMPKAEGGESSKKVTFILEPELINVSTLSETNTSTESRAETSMSGENSKKVKV